MLLVIIGILTSDSHVFKVKKKFLLMKLGTVPAIVSSQIDCFPVWTQDCRIFRQLMNNALLP